MSRTGPRPLAPALESLVADLAPPTALGAIQRAWPEVAGEAIAAAAQPVSEASGVVTVACRSAVWAQELDLLAGELAERLNVALGGSLVVRLRCVHGGRR